MREPFIRRVILRNYKSIRECDVTLGPLTFLIGPNGSGKSNFLNALRFVGDSLWTTMDQAVRERGGVRNIYHRFHERASDFSIDLRLQLPDGATAQYLLRVEDSNELFQVAEERCSVVAADGRKAEYVVENGELKDTTIPSPPPGREHELYLPGVSGHREFAPVYDSLRGMRFFDIDPQQIRDDLSSPVPERELLHNGRGVMFARHRLSDRAGQRVDEYLQGILPGLETKQLETKTGTMNRHIGEYHGTTIGSGSVDRDFREEAPKSLHFRFLTSGGHVAFRAQQMSNGTLRAFGVLVALFQCLDRPGDAPIRVVGIEEPENALHPAAAGILFDAIHEASHFTQVLVTTHSADLLDIKDLDPESLRMVDIVDGETIIGPVDEASKSIMRDRLATAGELLRQNQFRVEGQSPTPVPVDTDKR